MSRFGHMTTVRNVDVVDRATDPNSSKLSRMPVSDEKPDKEGEHEDRVHEHEREKLSRHAGRIVGS